MKAIFLILTCLSLGLTSCVTIKPAASTPITIEPKLSLFPPKPKIVEYTRKPVISKIDENYLISSELLGNSLLMKKYIEMIDRWKVTNSIK